MSTEPNPTTSRPVIRGGTRERGWFRSLGRLLGLATLAGLLRRTLFRSRARANATIGVTGGLIAALAAVGLFLPNTGPGRIVRSSAQAVSQVPRAIIPGIGSVTPSEGLTQGLPRPPHHPPAHG